MLQSLQLIINVRAHSVSVSLRRAVRVGGVYIYSFVGAGRNDLSLERTSGGTDRGKPSVLLLSLHPHLDFRRHVHRPDPYVPLSLFGSPFDRRLLRLGIIALLAYIDPFRLVWIGTLKNYGWLANSYAPFSPPCLLLASLLANFTHHQFPSTLNTVPYGSTSSSSSSPWASSRTPHPTSQLHRLRTDRALVMDPS